MIDYKKERKQLVKDVKEIVKESSVFKSKVKLDDNTVAEPHVCVIIGGFAHVEKSFDDEGRFDYIAYFISSTPGTYWDPPEYDEELIEGKNQYEKGKFENLEDAVIAALTFVAYENVHNYFEAKREAQAEKDLEPWM